MRKTISFTEEYSEEYMYVCSQPEASDYLRKLVRLDLKKHQDNIEERILKLLQQVVSDRSIKIDGTLNENKKKSLNNILKMGK
jgi:hypothetical protein